MEDMMTSTQTGGWVVALGLALIGLLKMAHESWAKRQETSAKDKREDETAAQVILKAQVQSLTSKVEALERQVSLLIEERQTLSTSQAALRVQLDAALAEVARLRKSRDRYREIALRARDEAARGTLEESSLGEELSVADEASSLS